MFQHIPPAILTQMRRLEEIDALDRSDGTPRPRRLRQIPPETGRFLAILVANAPAGRIVEIGTSAAYSTLWLALACLPARRKITTFEILEEKVILARETIRSAHIEDMVELLFGDARDHLPAIKDIAFCFLDAEKEIYADCYEAVVPNLVDGGLLLADNVISHRQELQPIIEKSLADERLDSVVVPIGNGLLLCRKT